MEIYLPTIEAKMTALVIALRFMVFALMVAGLIGAVGLGRVHNEGLFRLIVKATLIVAALAYEDVWFPKIETTFITIADYINPGFSDHPTASADAIRGGTTTMPKGSEFSWRKLHESIYQAVTSVFAHLFIYIGTLITVPMLILQYILRWLLYLIAPFALGVLMVPGMSGITIRFFQQLLAILAWPIGFALTNLVALAIWTDFRGAVSPATASVSDAVYSPLLTFMGGILATIMIVLGMISTPIVMQMLFAQGHAFSGSSVSPLGIIRGSANILSTERSHRASLRSAKAASAPATPPVAPTASRPTI